MRCYDQLSKAYRPMHRYNMFKIMLKIVKNGNSGEQCFWQTFFVPRCLPWMLPDMPIQSLYLNFSSMGTNSDFLRILLMHYDMDIHPEVKISWWQTISWNLDPQWIDRRICYRVLFSESCASGTVNYIYQWGSMSNFNQIGLKFWFLLRFDCMYSPNFEFSKKTFFLL